MARFTTLVMVPGDTKDVPGKVAELLAPYDVKIKVEPYKVYLRPDEVAEMAQTHHLPPTDLQALAAKMKQWDEDQGWVDEKGLYLLSDVNPDYQWESWFIESRDDEVFRGKSTVPVPEFLKRYQEDVCSAVVTPDGKWHDRGGIGIFDGTHIAIPDEKGGQEWMAETRELLEKCPGCLVVSVSIHC